MLLCVAKLNAAEDITINVPGQMSKIHSFAAAIRTIAPGTKQMLNSGGSVADKAQAVSGLAGSYAGLLNTAARVLDKAASAAGGVAGDLAEKGLVTMADALDSAANEAEKPFALMEKDIVSHKGDIIKAYNSIVGDLTITGAQALARGAPPYAREQYKACQPDAVTVYLTTQARPKLMELLGPLIKETAAKHDATKAWDKVALAFNTANEKLGQLDFAKPFVSEPVNLDVESYVVQETMSSLGKLMGAEEMALRSSPEGKSKKPQTFAVVFSGDTIMSTHYKHRRK